MTKAVLQNYLTTLFGILAGLPVIAVGAFPAGTLTPTWTHILLITGGIGTIGLGVVAKAFNVHSTEAQVAASTATVMGNPAAPAMVVAADKQVATQPAQPKPNA
jgi:hypothetical protein